MKSIETLKKQLTILEEKLELAKEVNKTLAEYTYDWEYWLDSDKKFKYISPSCKRISGFSKEEFIAEPELFYKQIIDDDKALWLDHEKDTQRHIHCQTPLKLRFKTKSGNIIYIEHICRPVFSNNKKFWGYRGINRDITQTKLNERSIINAIIQTEEKERRRIAQDLHDGLGPVISAAKMCFETYLASADSEFNKQLEQQVLLSMNDALEQVSTISNNLSPHILTDFGLKVAVKKFASSTLKTRNIQQKIEISDVLNINPDVEITLYRTLTELINNTIKHANAKSVSIKLWQDLTFVNFEFSNNGRWFDLDANKDSKNGMGLLNLKNRIQSLNGNIKFEKLVPKGIKYTIAIPID